ncbi:unnamed protein product [Cladocopium goreaui]|uniref:Uncharacterized protein n=1 Tax=Cladocopium goreaui TaxID=2562237 RepID=A0A9P1FND0_9DINO|nr:unnamed protein product [Cladocopium goreaui]
MRPTIGWSSSLAMRLGFARLQGFKGCKFDLKYNSNNRVPPRKSNYMDVNSPSGFVLCIIFLLKGRAHDFLSWFGIKCSSWTQMNVGTSSRVSRVHWSMGAFGGETAKPQYAYSNSPAIRKLYHFRPTANKVKKVHTKVETCRTYKNRDGKDCYVGTKHLKDTEIYPDYFASTISVLIDDLKAAQRGTPEVPDPVPPALESFQDLNSGKGSDLFEFADLESAFRYLRKGHSLRIPEGWAHHVPKSI